MRHPRIVRKLPPSLEAGQLYYECPPTEWEARLTAWRADHANLCPMPWDHCMFRDPAAYRCEAVPIHERPDGLFAGGPKP